VTIALLITPKAQKQQLKEYIRAPNGVGISDVIFN
jgi:hypothetical protein